MVRVGLALTYQPPVMVISYVPPTAHDARRLPVRLLLITLLAAARPLLVSGLPYAQLPGVVAEVVARGVIGRSALDLVQCSPTLDFLAESGSMLLDQTDKVEAVDIRLNYPLVAGLPLKSVPRPSSVLVPGITRRRGDDRAAR